MSGSLSLSLAFFAAVWYMSSQYDKVKDERPTDRVTPAIAGAESAGAGGQVKDR
jgi:hypothetical protein